MIHHDELVTKTTNHNIFYVAGRFFLFFVSDSIKRLPTNNHEQQKVVYLQPLYLYRALKNKVNIEYINYVLIIKFSGDRSSFVPAQINLISHNIDIPK